MLLSEPLLEVDSAPIRELAGQLVRPSQEPSTIAAIIVGWVHGNLTKSAVIGIPSAAEVLRTRTGDCNEHAVLTVALLRAAGVPARVVTGIAHMEGNFYYHAWVEYWDDAWVAADPTWAQIPADVGHLRFVVGGLERQMEILGLLGNLEVAGLDAPAPGEQGINPS
jgi:transglutaminase-like putative cysteine protease